MKIPGHGDLDLFGSYMKLTGVPHISEDIGPDPELSGKRIGLINGGAWIQLWSYYFGRKYLPGVKLVNISNEAVQLNFMRAYHNGKQCPPESNIKLFAEYARQLIDLAKVDAIMITCSTMNRSLDAVKKAVEEFSVPVIQIDEAMMEKAVKKGGNILIAATHGPTVESTKNLLIEKSAESSTSSSINYRGVTVEEAFEALGNGDIERHNRIIADAISGTISKHPVDRVVLAQLSMSVFSLSYPDPEAEFGVPVLNSGEEGFKMAAEVLRSIRK